MSYAPLFCPPFRNELCHLTSRLTLLTAEEGWLAIDHLANLSSSTTTWKTLHQNQMGGRQRKNTQGTEGFWKGPHPPPSLPGLFSLSTSTLHFEKWKHPTLPNNYDIFIDESYLLFLLNVNDRQYKRKIIWFINHRNDTTLKEASIL